jgi:hypothetical protein
MPPLTKDVIKFGSFVVTSQVSARILTCHWQAADYLRYQQLHRARMT